LTDAQGEFNSTPLCHAFWKNSRCSQDNRIRNFWLISPTGMIVGISGKEAQSIKVLMRLLECVLTCLRQLPQIGCPTFSRERLLVVDLLHDVYSSLRIGSPELSLTLTFISPTRDLQVISELTLN